MQRGPKLYKTISDNNGLTFTFDGLPPVSVNFADIGEPVRLEAVEFGFRTKAQNACGGDKATSAAEAREVISGVFADWLSGSWGEKRGATGATPRSVNLEDLIAASTRAAKSLKVPVKEPAVYKATWERLIEADRIAHSNGDAAAKKVSKVRDALKARPEIQKALNLIRAEKAEKSARTAAAVRPPVDGSDPYADLV